MGPLQKKDTRRWPEWMRPGARVVRGPEMVLSKKSTSVELGTITYVPAKVDDNKVIVVWDSGRERIYKSGATGIYELRAYDIQQVGVHHSGVTCNGCDTKPLRGIRFYCPETKTNLCVSCYMADKGDVKKSYYRKDTPNSDSVMLPLRSLPKSQMMQLRGIFENAKVVQGPHWNYTDNQGDSTDTGTVQSIIPVKDGVGMGWVKVKWDVGGKIAEYRVGANGCVEVIAAECKEKGNVYLEHLPVVGIIQLKPSDKVSVNMTTDEFKSAQTKALGNAGWIDGMKQCLSEDGTVLAINTDDSLATVQYKDGSIYSIVSTALFRKASFYPKCVVTIIGKKDALNTLQQGHGQYSPEICGKLGRVLRVQRDGDLLVIVGKHQYTLNPTCCEPVDDPQQTSKAPDMPEEGSYEAEDQYQKGSNFEASIRSLHSRLKKADRSLESAAKEMYDALTAGDNKKLAAIIKKNKQLVKYRLDDKTILHLACYEGMKDVVEQLIKLGGNIEEEDDQGDRPLHYAVYGGKTDCVRVLLKNKASIDSQNKDGTTALMAAIDDANIDTVQLLISSNASVAIKDGAGSTAMHEAITQTDDQPVLTAAVLGTKSADFTIVNNKQCNVLHWAVLRNNIKAVEIILNLKPEVIKTTMPGCFTALHIAAANDCIELAGMILGKKLLEVNVKDSNQMTPLHLAALQGHKRIIELLISEKADVNAKDSEGNTPLHLAVSPKVRKNTQLNISTVGINADMSIKIIYVLLENGADLDCKNMQSKAALDLIEDVDTKKMIEGMASKYQKKSMKSSKYVNCPMYWVEMDNQEFIKVELDLQSKVEPQEHGDVVKQFKSTIDYANVDAIYRVQNPMLWNHYVLKKMEMERRYGKGQANEIHLYHGTKADLVDVICKENFDFRIAGINVGARLGKGAYFAKTAKYSDGFASRDKSGFKYIFVVKVLVGKICQGNKDMVKPEPISAKNLRDGHHDTAVDNLKSPKIYCVFDKNQYYPEYVIRYNML